MTADPIQNKEHILVVEDSPTQAEQLRYQLEQNHYRVSLSKDGNQALVFLGGNIPSLIISDINMPEMSGYELCQHIKEDKVLRDIPVILLTSLANAQDVLEGLACGADGFITKPYKAEYLLEHIQRTLSESSSQPKDRVKIEVELALAGKNHVFKAGPQQMLKLLLSIYEVAVHRNSELIQSQAELQSLNEHLEELVAERTAALTAEVAERKHAEEKKKKLEEEYRLLAENSPDLIARFDTDLRHLYVNPAAAKAGNLSASEYVGLTIPESGVPELTAGIWEERLRQVIHTNYALDVVDTFPTPDGTRYFNTSFVPEADSSGKVISVLSTARDITQLKQIEEALIESNAFNEMLLQTIPFGMDIVDERGQLLFLNPAMKKAVGQNGLGERCWELYKDDKKQCVDCPLLKPIELGVTHDLESSGVLSGRTFEISHTGMIFHGQNAVLEVFHDITGRKKSEEKLLASEARFRTIFSQAPLGIALIDSLSGAIHEVNPHFAEIAGRSIEEMKNIDWMQITHPDDVQADQDKMALLNTGKTNGFQMEKRYLHPDGKVVWINMTIAPLYLEGKINPHHLCMIEDISERKQAEMIIREYAVDLERRVEERTLELNRTNLELERANRTKDEFLATMSHELRTPLTSILGLSESLLEQIYGPLSEPQQKTLHIIESSGHHLLMLINDVLDLSKIEAGKFDYSPQVVEVDDLCRSSLAFIGEAALRKSITITYVQKQDISKVYADPRRLKQVLVNLLTNAVKFTPNKGEVILDVNIDAEQERIRFSVSDNGIGIAPKDLRKIFQPFVQVDSSLSREYEGTGLGLVLVQKMADLHGGSVDVESEIGKGSRFTVNLPWVREQITQQIIGEPAIKSAHKLGDQSRKHGVILLAEDNLSNILMVGDYLEDHGYQVVVAHEGVEALKMAEAHHPDIILMDIQMPVMDGMEAIRRLREIPRFASTPIIALTALAMPGDRERCLATGANEYLSKPVSLKKLIQTIGEMLA